MSTFRKVDPSTLSWVKSEIDETLKQARLALEAFVENPTDQTRLRFCVTHLHQVVGTLLMVELDGAAMLAKELEALASDVLEEKTPASNDVLETLTRGILVLPDYLGRLQFGYPDVPLKHLPLINELRLARKADPISELELFTPDLSVRPPPSEFGVDKLTDLDYAALAKQLRPPFQAALLEWLRRPERKALEQISRIIISLQEKAGFGPCEQLFWVAQGLVEGFLDGSLEPTNERKKHLSRLDQQIKQVVDGTEKSVLRSSCETLVRKMLLELGLAKASGPKITQLKRAFDLELLLSAGAPKGDIELYDTPTPEVLQSVSKALAVEIEQAQDLLSTAFDPDHGSMSSLQSMVGLLHKMSSTLEMLGVPLLKALVDELAHTCLAIVEQRVTAPERASMPMAQALLLVESSAREINTSAGAWRTQIEHIIHRLRGLHSAEGTPVSEGIEVADAELTDTEYKQLLGVVAGEVGVNLGKIEEALEAFAASPAELERLDDIPKQLGQIQGALSILGIERTVELAGKAREHIQAIREGRVVVDSAILDGLAVCIGTIGAYVEGLRAGRKNIDSLIDAAMREMSLAMQGKRMSQSAVPTVATGSVAAIREHLDAWLASPSEISALESLEQKIGEFVHAGHASEQEKIARIGEQMNKLLRLVRDDSTVLSPEIIETLNQSCDALASLSSETAKAGVSKTAPAKETLTLGAQNKPVATPALHTQSDADFDSEIMQIFIEDARDVYTTITRELARWQVDTENQSALAELRRGYHTLKGSGRMVGASDIAELAWAVESVLNNVRDGKITVTPAVLGILEQVQTVLPDMIGQLAGGPGPNADIALMRETAHQLARPGSAPAVRDSKPAAPSGPSEALPKLDQTLLEIFTNEARGHISVVRQEIIRCREAGGGMVSPALTRSIHTLQGNARSLGIRMMSEACAEIEKLLHSLTSQSVPLNETHLSVLERFEATVSELVKELNNGGSLNDLPRRFEEVARQAHAESAHLTVPEPDDYGTQEQAEEITLSSSSVEEAVAEEADAELETEQMGAAAKELEIDQPVDPELFEIFREEAVDILNTIEHSLREWRAETNNMVAVQELKRALHTLKGGARMAGAMAMGNLSHSTETVLIDVENRKLEPSSALFDIFEETHDALVSMLDRLNSGQAAPDTRALTGKLARLTTGEPEPTKEQEVEVPAIDGDATGAPVVEEFVAQDFDGAESITVESVPTSGVEPDAANDEGDLAPVVTEPGDQPEPVAERRDIEEPERRPEKVERRGQIRVNTGLLNELVNYAGEVSISRSRMEQQIYGFRDNLAELSRNATRFRDQLRELEIQSESQILYRLEQRAEEVSGGDFDPLELDRFSKLQQLTRSLTESLHDLTTIQLNLGNFAGEAEAVLQQQARINTELQEGLMRTRMVEFSTQAARLRHIVRQTSRELGKRAELDLTGADVHIDRTVLERMIGPFEHMIRNSLDHGIEPEAERLRSGKPAVGRISIASAQEGSEIVIRFSDDGAGINIDVIRKKAIERGMIAPDANLSEDDFIQFILVSGFSTADQVTHLSGRGVGMDVVHNEVKQLGGTMAVDTKRGAGTTFIIRLPLTLSITQALMVYVGDQTFAVPLSSVLNIIEYPIDKLNSLTMEKNPVLNYGGQDYAFMNLGARLGIPQPAERLGRKVPVLLARTGTREVAMQIDSLGGTREIVIKALGPQLTELKGLAGATILGDGRVVLILDVAGLWFRDDAIHIEHRPEKVVEEVRDRPIVMVVDDSLTVRKVTGKHLQKRGLEVMVAKDGIDAVEQLRDRIPDLMLVDIEMPRMDGYELTSRVRSDSRLKHIPIIMITSRSGSKHRQRAFDLGVDMYMSKPYQEEELFGNIDTLLASGRAN